MEEQLKQSSTDTEKENKQPQQNNDPTINFLMNELKELRDKTNKLEFEKINLESQVKQLKEVESENNAIALKQDEISSVYNNFGIKPKRTYTPEEANQEFNRRIELVERHIGQPSEEFYFGNTPTDLWAAQWLKSRKLINTLEDFYRVKYQAAKDGI